MGTRNMTMVVQDGDFKVAQYGQWDGYPSCTGLGVLDFLKRTDLGHFAAEVKKLSVATPEEIKDLWVKAGADPDSEFVSMEVSEKFGKLAPQFSRDTGYEILDLINRGKVKAVNLQTEFAGDGLFCEWAYVIDLDKQTLEVYKGFTKGDLPETERFAYLNGTCNNKDYGPVRLIKSYELKDLPPSPIFLRDCDPEGDE